MPIDDKTLYFAQQHPAPTTMKCSGIISLAASGVNDRPSQVEFSTMGLGVTRKLAIISNHDSSQIHVLDVRRNLGVVVWPRTSIPIETDDNFIVACMNGGTSALFSVMELMLSVDVSNSARVIQGSGPGLAKHPMNRVRRKSLFSNWPAQISGFYRITSPPGPVQFRPTLLKPEFTEGVFAFSTTTEAGKTYTAQYTTNFVTWTDFYTFPGTGGVVTVLDEAANVPFRFYRTRTVINTTQAEAAPLLAGLGGIPLVTEKGFALAAL